MSVWERIWIYYGPHAKRGKDGFVDLGYSEGQHVHTVNLLEDTNAEGYLVHDRWLTSDVSLNREQWNDHINDSLVDAYQQVIPDLNHKYSKYDMDIVVSLEYAYLVAWTIREPPRPHVRNPNSLIIHKPSEAERAIELARLDRIRAETIARIEKYKPQRDTNG